MVTQVNLGEMAVEVVFKDIKNIHLSVQGTNFSAATDDYRQHPGIHHHQTGVDQAATEKTQGTKPRDAARISEPGKPLCLGQTLPAQGHGKRRHAENRAES